VVIGAPMATPYPGRQPHATEGPAAVRAASARLARFVGHHDFDTGSAFATWHASLADLGDVPARADDAAGNRDAIRGAVASAIAAGSRPIVLGGDDSVAIPFLDAYREAGPVTVVQLDAHLDFRHEVDGETHGYSSPMRRASEMPWVRRVVHVGLRGVGSARPADVAESRDAGNRLITAGELRAGGVAVVTAELSSGEPFVVVLDCDVTEPSQLPAVKASVPDGVPAATVGELLDVLSRHAAWRGLVVTELEPPLDVNGISSLVVARWIARLLDAASAHR
jgi:agmatinase